MKLHYAERLDECPVFVVNAVRHHHAELCATYAYSLEFLHGDEHTLWVGEGIKFGGATLWTPIENGKVWWVWFTCTAQRRKGVYLALRKELVRRARKDKVCRTIESHVAVSNTRMVELMKRVGSIPVSYKFRYAVKGT